MENYKQTKIIKLALTIIFVIFMTYYSFWPQFKDLRNKSFANKKQQKIDYIEYKVSQIKIFLNPVSAIPKTYPDNLKSVKRLMEIQISPDIDKRGQKLIGKKITTDDFEYTTDGKSYSLCFESDFLNKCWKNSIK